MRIENRTGRKALIATLIISFVLGALITGVSGPQTPRLLATTSGDARLAADVRASLTTEVGYQSLSAARLQNGQIAYAGLGSAGDGQPPAPQTPFEAGSITKTFTGSLLAEAVRHGEMRLSDPVSTYVPELSESAVGATTLQQLATHTGGLPPFPDAAIAGVAARIVTNANSYGGSVAAMIEDAASTKINNRGSYRYSNLGMALLGHAEARAANAPDWPTLATDRLLRPLSMRQTLFAIETADIPATGARPHDENGWPGAYWYGPAYTPAGSSTWTTTDDLMIFARAALDGSLPGRAALEPVAEIPGGSIGLAWHHEEIDGREITWHNGATGGSSAVLALDRDRRQVVVIMGNSIRDTDSTGLRLAATAPDAPVNAVEQSKINTVLVVAWSAMGLALVAGLAIRRSVRAIGWR